MTAAPPAVEAPRLKFEVEDVAAAPHAALPTLVFRVRVRSEGPEVRSLALNVQVRIDARRRGYDAGERERLFELFGRPSQWDSTLRSLLWTHASATVPGFAEETAVELPVGCTYDFDVVAAKYLHALDGTGSVPLELLFSGSVFYADAGRLQVAPVPWDRECRARLPVRVWREAMDAAFPNSAWIRLGRDAFDRLQAYRSSRALPTWDAALEQLLEEG